MDGGAWCPWGCKELDTTERLHFVFYIDPGAVGSKARKDMEPVQGAVRNKWPGYRQGRDKIRVVFFFFYKSILLFIFKKFKFSKGTASHEFCVQWP